MSSNVIKLEKNAVIEYSSIDRIAKEVDEKLSKYNFDQLVVDEESVKGIKKLRAELGQDYKEFEEARKTIKKKILETYDTFNADYELKIASKYKLADSKLKMAIDDVENGIKKEKETELIKYFDEQAKLKLFDFVEFEQASIKIGLNDKVEKLKEQVDEFLNNIDKDVDVIATQKNDKRILVEYKKHLDVRKAISTVLADVEQEEMLIKKEAEKQAVVEEPKPTEAPKVDTVKKEPIKEEPLLVVAFKVTGTHEQLVQLRNYMKEEGIKYE